ncbi:MAG: hypothetical protein AB1390_05765 [Nitrospirota bacterium]
MTINRGHPLRRLFRQALDFGFIHNPSGNTDVAAYLEEEVLSEFVHVDNLYKIRNAKGRRLEDIADLLMEGDILLNAKSFSREFEVHKHIGDYTLFMVGMFPTALYRKRGKEFVLGSIIIPDSDLSEHYIIQGKRSYRIASEFAQKKLFMELSKNFVVYMKVLELVRIYLESVKDKQFLRAKKILSDSE